MITILLVGLLACASAAPRRCHHPSALSPFDGSLERFLNKQRFETNRYWDEWTRNLNREMMQMETRWSDFHKHFPNMQPTEGIEGNEYRITIPLTGFEQKDITVTAGKGLLTMQAVHSGANENIYLYERSLPMCVGEQGSWFYENGVLKIVLPVVESCESGPKEVTPAAATPVPDRSHEETENPVHAHGGKTNEIPTEPPKVEATTNAADYDDGIITVTKDF